MVTTMREREVFLLQPGREQPDYSHSNGKSHSFVLVVEDDTPTLRLERVILEEEGYAVEVVGSGEEALDFLAKESPSLVLLDIGLPGLDGFATCAKIREFSTVPVIMVTGRDCLDDKVRGMDVSADDYVTKPFLTHELATRVKVVLRRTSLVSVEQQYFHQVAQQIAAASPGNTELLPATSDPAPSYATSPEPTDNPIAAKPAAISGSYEGTVRLAITTLGPVRNLINFVSELRQNSQFRLLRLVANPHTEGMDIWLGLREPLPLVNILTGISGVHAVGPRDSPDAENEEQLLIVTLD
ncbi:MAG: response regulator transcription factor [Chloroflexi bacterium]|nr:response regulator transcription factor [Chloroflexota bacterium]